MRRQFKEFMARRQKGSVLPVPIAKVSLAASHLNKRWVNEVTYADCVKTLRDCGVVLSVIVGEKEYFSAAHRLGFHFEETLASAEKKVYTCMIETVAGQMEFESVYTPRQPGVLTKNVCNQENGLKKLAAYLDEAADNIGDIIQNLQQIRKEVGKDGLIQFFLPQPFELYCLAGREEAIYLMYDKDPDFETVKQKTTFFTHKLVKEVAKSGLSDMFLFGSAGSEIYSPEIFESEFLNQSCELIDIIQKAGGISCYHACGKMRVFLEKGYLDEIVPDIYEGLAFKPSGDLEGKHIRGLPESIVLKGNIGLDALLNGTPEAIRAEVKALLDEINERPLLLSGACDLLYGTPLENVAVLGEYEKYGRI
jgi:uroporphyrinogen-III decarboxylase